MRIRTCAECGAKMTETRGPAKWGLTPGWAATVEDAHLYRCPKCGAVYTGFDAPLHMAQAILQAVLAKPRHLAAPEIVYLRKVLDLSAKELASKLAITTGTLSRWENGHETIGAGPDRLLRLLVARQEALKEPSNDVLTSIEDRPGAPLKIRVSRVGGTWEASYEDS